MKSKIERIIKNPFRYIAKLALFSPDLFSDKQYVKACYMYKFGYPLNLNNPNTFCEKLQWLKLYDRNSLYTTMVDKYEAKNYVCDIIGDEYIIPTLGAWDKPENIEWDKLPNQFVLKTTHGGGGNGVIACKNKQNLEISRVKEQLNHSLNVDLYKSNREWPYKNVKKQIIAEEFIASNESELKDYKFFVFNGKVKFFKIDFGRFVEHHANYYDVFGNILPFGEKGLEPDFSHYEAIPTNLTEMIQIAEKLSINIPFLRVDLYNVEGKIYFGETTFYPAAGLGDFVPEEWNLIIGDMLKLNINI